MVDTHISAKIMCILTKLKNKKYTPSKIKLKRCIEMLKDEMLLDYGIDDCEK
jgi:hypothetical protein